VKRKARIVVYREEFEPLPSPCPAPRHHDLEEIYRWSMEIPREESRTRRLTSLYRRPWNTPRE